MYSGSDSVGCQIGRGGGSLRVSGVPRVRQAMWRSVFDDRSRALARSGLRGGHDVRRRRVTGVVELQELLLTTDTLPEFLHEVAYRAAGEVSPGPSCGLTARSDGRPLTIASSDGYANMVLRATGMSDHPATRLRATPGYTIRGTSVRRASLRGGRVLRRGGDLPVMSGVSDALGVRDADQRTSCIVDTLVEAFADLMAADPAAFRAKFRKMAADPFAFYRGSDCLFYADVARLEDPWVDERTRRVWIQGDLHAENFGTYMDGSGALIFDVNDFDEAYLGHFTWDVQRLAASVALLGWRQGAVGREHR